MNYLRNIKVNYAFTFIKNVDLTNGIWMLYLASKGLSLFEIGLLEGIFHITSMLMETPTGALADIFGRKASRLLGVVLMIGSRVLMIFSGSFAMFAIAFAITALSYNFESGAGEALVYDSLLTEKKQDRYMRVAGRTELIYQLTSILGLIAGGFAGSIKYEFAYCLAIVFGITAFVIGLLFKEPGDKKESRALMPALKAQYRESFKAMRESGRLLYLILFTGILSSSVTLSFYYLQIAWENGSMDTIGIGIYLAVSSAAAAAGAFFAERIEKKFGERFILKASPVIITLSVFSMYFIDWALAPLCAISVLESMVFVATRDYINRLIPSERRATILSFESMMFSVVMILIFPLFGFVSDNIGMNNTFLALGAVMLAMSVVNLKMVKKNGLKEHGNVESCLETKEADAQ